MAFESDDSLVFSSRKVMFDDWPLLLVSDNEDGAWQFVNGWGEGVQDVARVHVEHILERDPSIAALADLPVGWQAGRTSPEEAGTASRSLMTRRES